jgi:hypothetical protein
MKPFQLLLRQAQMEYLVETTESNPAMATMDIIRKIRDAIEKSYNEKVGPGGNGIFIALDNAELVMDALDRLAQRNENLAVATVSLENKCALLEAVIDEVMLDVPEHVQEAMMDTLEEIKDDH